METDKIACVADVDDLWHPSQIEQWLVPIKEAVPDFRVTAYAIPNRLGPVHQLKEKYPWVTFAQHGWEHPHFECCTWTYEDAEKYLRLAREMGYAPLFKAPNWVTDVELEQACKEAGVVLHHHHQNYLPVTAGLRCYPGLDPSTLKRHVNIHTHIVRGLYTDFIEDVHTFMPENLKEYSEFLTPLEVIA